MKPILTVICPSLEHRNFVDQASLKRMRDLPVEFLRLVDNDFRSTGQKTVDLINLARGEWVMGMGDDDILHPSFFDLVLPRLRSPKNLMIGFNVRAIRDSGAEDIVCKINPAFGPFPMKTNEVPVGVERWEGYTQFRPFAMVSPVRRRLFDGLDPKNVINKSWCEDLHLMAHIIPQLGDGCYYIDKDLYFAFPLANNPDRKKWSKRYDD
jgi:hypothetical protein